MIGDQNTSAAFLCIIALAVIGMWLLNRRGKR